MILIKRLAALAIIVLLGIFAVQNQAYLGQKVELRFFPWQASLVLGFWLVVAFLMGILLFLAVDFPRTLALKRDLRKRNHEIARLQAEVDRLAATANRPGAADTGKRLIS